MKNRISREITVISSLLWNASGSVWSGVLLLLVTPVYLSKLGFGGYGIVGIWLSLQMLMGLFDFGLGATLTKRFAQAVENNKIISRQNYLKTFEIIYLFISFSIFILFFVSSKWIVTEWFNFSAENDEDMTLVFRLMGLSLALQFPFNLFFGGLNGLQLHKKMNLVQAGSNTLRYSLGLLVLLWSPSLTDFFISQAIASLIIIISLRKISWDAILDPLENKPIFNKGCLKESWKFSAGMGLNSFVAVLLGSMDKIILAKLVSPIEFGQYALAFTAAGCLQIGIQPFYRVYFPRYSSLFAEKKYDDLKREYFEGCTLLAKFILPVMAVGCFLSPQIFFCWTGESDTTLVNIFRWLLIGIGLSGIGWLPAGLQQAQGLTKLHIYMMFFALIVGALIMIFMVDLYGVIGGVSLWITHGVIEVTVGLWLMHKFILKGELLSWYRKVFIRPLIVSLVFSYVSFLLFPDGQMSRVFSGLWVFVTITLLLCIVMGSELGRILRINRA